MGRELKMGFKGKDNVVVFQHRFLGAQSGGRLTKEGICFGAIVLVVDQM